MFSGLLHLSSGPRRHIREESVTLTDPWISEAFHACADPADVVELEGWSRSYYTLEGHTESLLRYNKPLIPQPTDDDWKWTKTHAHNMFSEFGPVRAMSAMQDLKQVRYQEGTSAGYGYSAGLLPYPTRKGPRGGGNYKRALGIASKTIFNIRDHVNAGTFESYLSTVPLSSTPDVAFTRTQLTEVPNLKIRNVFGEAFHYVLLEGIFAEPLIKWFMEHDTFYYIGEDPVKGVPLILSRLPQSHYKLTTDWSRFDASVQVWEIELAFDLLERMIAWPNDGNPEVTKALFKYVRTLFISRKIQSPVGDLYLRTGGVPSGSYFTHIIDSIVNYNRMMYLLKKQNIIPDTIKTHGDDGLISTVKFPDLYKLVSDGAELGWILTLEKLNVEVDPSRVTFLGRSTSYGLNTREIVRSRRLMMFPEYPVNDVQISIARMKAIDIDTGGNDPLFSKMYFYLKNKYGDLNVPLPHEHRRFNIVEYYMTSV